jgi:hypothetical protein
VVEDEVYDDANVSFAGFRYKIFEIIHSSILRIDFIIICNIVTVIRRGWVNGHQPDGVDSKRLDVIQFLGDTIEIADPISIGVVKRADEYFIEDRFVPPVG